MRVLSKKERLKFLKAWDAAVDSMSRCFFILKLGKNPRLAEAFEAEEMLYEDCVEKMREVTGLPSEIQMPIQVGTGA